MKIDCSKLSNKGEVMTVIALVILVAAIAAVLLCATYIDSFAAGFLCATAVWNWKRWLYDPMDRLLDKCWPEAPCTPTAKKEMR
jgi:hypothetical protein